MAQAGSAATREIFDFFRERRPDEDGDYRIEPKEVVELAERVR